MKKLFKKKSFTRFIIPALAIGLIINANLGNKKKVDKGQLMWPVRWIELKVDECQGLHDEIIGKINNKAMQDDLEEKRKKWRLPSRDAVVKRLVKDCEEEREYKRIIFTESLPEACEKYKNAEQLLFTYDYENEKRRRKYEIGLLRLRSVWDLSESDFDRLRGTRPLSIDVGDYKLKQMRNEIKRRIAAWDETYEPIGEMISKATWIKLATGVEVLRQAGFKDWKLYSRWNWWGVHDLISEAYDKGKYGRSDFKDLGVLKYTQWALGNDGERGDGETLTTISRLCRPWFEIPLPFSDERDHYWLMEKESIKSLSDVERELFD